MKTIAFFNNKGGVGKTSLVYHVAHTLADMGTSVVVADLDPQSNLTSMLLSEGQMEEMWGPDSFDDRTTTIYRSVRPLLEVGDIAPPVSIPCRDSLALVAGDIQLSTFEDELSRSWTDCLGGTPRPFFVMSAFHRALQSAAQGAQSEIVLIDVGPNMGAINRAALICSDYVVIPVGADLFAIQGLINLGPQLRKWRHEWAERQAKLQTESPNVEVSLPSGDITPVGYVAMQYATYSKRPTKAYERWLSRIPTIYKEKVLDSPGAPEPAAEHAHRLATMKHYRSLMPMAQMARKPIFHLTAADGALGSHSYAVQDCRRDFQSLTRRILEGAEIPVAPT